MTIVKVQLPLTGGAHGLIYAEGRKHAVEKSLPTLILGFLKTAENDSFAVVWASHPSICVFGSQVADLDW